MILLLVVCPFDAYWELNYWSFAIKFAYLGVTELVFALPMLFVLTFNLSFLLLLVVYRECWSIYGLSSKLFSTIFGHIIGMLLQCPLLLTAAVLQRMILAISILLSQRWQRCCIQAAGMRISKGLITMYDKLQIMLTVYIALMPFALLIFEAWCYLLLSLSVSLCSSTSSSS